MSVEAPHNPDTQLPQEPEKPVVLQAPETQAAPPLTEAKVSRRGFLKLGAIVGGAVLVAGGVGAGIWKASQGSGEQQPIPGATDSIKPQPSPSESETAETDPLSPLNLWKMTPEERLAAVTVDKEILKDLTAYPARLTVLEQAILNAGTTDEEYAWWSKNLNKNSGENYGDYIFDTYHRPLLSRLWGEAVDNNIKTSTPRQIAHLVDNAAFIRTQGLKVPVEHFTTECQVVSEPQADGNTVTFAERWSHPTIDSLDVALPQVFTDEAVANVRAMMVRSQESTTIVSGLHYDSEKETVQPRSVLHKA